MRWSESYRSHHPNQQIFSANSTFAVFDGFSISALHSYSFQLIKYCTVCSYRLCFYSKHLSKCLIRRHCNEIFDLKFFHCSNLPGPLTNGSQKFRFWLGFWRVIQILSLKKLTPWRFRPQEIDSPGYQSLGSHILVGFLTFLLHGDYYLKQAFFKLEFE